MAFCSKCGASLADGAQFCGVCGSPVGGAGPARPAQPVTPQYGGYQQPNNSWDSYGGGYGAPPQRKAAPSNKATLRILSIVFAVGFLIFSFGMSGNIFYNRQVSSFVDEDYESEEKSIREAEKDKSMSSENIKKAKEELQKDKNRTKHYRWKYLAPALKCDVVGTLRATIPELSYYDEEDRDQAKKDIQNYKEMIEEGRRNKGRRAR